MKKKAAALMGLFALVIASGLLLFHYQGSKDPDKQQNSKDTAAVEPREHGPQEQRIAELAKQKTSASRQKLIDLYAAWAGKPEFENDRRAIISHIVQNEEPSIAINTIVTAVSKDPIPLEDDEMLSTIARDMVAVWRDESFVAKGRDLLRLTKDVKAKALVGESLSWRVNAPESDLPSVQNQAHELASDLIQTYLQTNDADLKRRMLQNVEMVAGPDVAEVVANPENAENSRLAKRLEQSRQEAADQARSAQ
jgi:hypothetical protein